VLKFLSGGLVLPPNPFAGVEFFERASMRYESKIDTPALIEAAQRDLGGVPEDVEAWKAFVPLMFAGLRKNEADKLRWESVDFAAGVLRIEDHEHFQAKCEASKGSIELDAEVVSMLRGWRALDRDGVFVLRSAVAPLANALHYHYRAKRTFDALAAWLKSKGITSAHYLDKKQRVTVGLGGLLSAPMTASNVTAFPMPMKQAKPLNAKRKRGPTP
jgi:integrase